MPLIASTGSPDARIFILGEAPGREELEKGRPFVGPSGRVLWGAAPFDRTSCFVTNVVQSRPLGKSGSPTATQIQDEWDRLDGELRASQATVIVCVGGIALKRITGFTSITDLRGYLLTPEDCRMVARMRQVQRGVYLTSRKGHYQKGDPKYGLAKVAEPPVLPPNCKWIIPVLHPAGIMRMQFKTIPALRADLERAWRAANDQLSVVSRATTTSPPEPRAQDNPLVAVDIETPMPPMDHVIERIGIASTGLAWSHVWDGLGLEAAKRALGGAVVAFHNAAYDMPRLAQVGVPMTGKLWDTMYAAQLLHPDLPKGLGRCATLLLDLRPWKHLSEDAPEFYNEMDALVTWHLANRQMELMGGMRPVFEQMMRTLPRLMAATERGVRIDLQGAARWREQLQAEIRLLLAMWPVHVNPASPQQLARYLYDELGLERQYNKFGGTTTDDVALGRLQEMNPALSQLVTLRALRQKRRDLETYASVDTGRVHPHYLVADKDEAGANFTQKGHGAGTGRIQARDPNVMNMTRAGRRLFIPEMGHHFVYIDWHSAEARVEAALSGDKALMQAIEGDLHGVIQRELGIDRTRSKNIFYGTGRGAGPRTLARTLADAGFKTTEKECREIQSKLFGLFGDWARWRHRLVLEGQARRYLDNPFGRRRHFYNSNPTAMIGWMPQSTVADMFWRVLEPMEHLAIPMHDAVLLDLPPEIPPRAYEEIMRQEFPEIAPGFKVPVEVKVGLIDESWGSMEERLAHE